ncbi:MAG TPA: hypothetical protein VM123_07985 [archaeon]|nr:hypothetical protein [archaeon]
MHLLKKALGMLPLSVISLAFLAGSHGTALAASKVTYIPDIKNVQEIILENEVIRYAISVDKSVWITSAMEKATGISLLAGNPPLMFLSIRSFQNGADVGYNLFTVKEEKGAEDVTVRITQSSGYVENPLVVTQSFTLGQGPLLAWNVKVLNSATGGRAYRQPQTVTSRITFPLMQKLKLGSETEMHYLIPTGGDFFCIDSPRDFIFYFTDESDPKLPIDIYNTELKRGIYFHIIKSPLRFSFADKNDFTSGVFSLTQKPGEETGLLDCRICPHEGDWHAAYSAFREYIRSGFDFTYYKRPIQTAYRERLVSHFTFLYGHDIYDPATDRFRIDEFLDEGELNFGGYDYMLLWHDYPRTGLDDRDQFDMYEGLPGGLEGLREMVARAHARNVQVFIPYKPWDIMKGRKDHFQQEARIAKAVGADGIFLDTMSESDRAFRDALDAVSRDIVLVAEGRPDLEAAQMVTGSWNQRGNATNRMPNVDLFRFIFPEHNVHNINRGARKRDELIYNALFNGVGFIVWEDIFGEINRFPWNERILIRRYSRIIHENRDAYLTGNPVPLVADLRDDLYVNAFPVDNKCVYPAYHLGRITGGSGERLIGPFMEVGHPDNWHYVDLWNHQAIRAEKRNGKTTLVFPEEVADVMSCIAAMPENLKVERQGELLRIETAKPLEGASIQVNTVDNLTMMEEEALKLEGTGGVVQLDNLKLDFPYLVLVKLMQGGILKDEVILDLGWKRF